MRNLTQKVVVRGKPGAVFDELLKWSEAEWWPHIPMKFIRVSEQVGENALYLQRAKIPFGPKWHTKVACIDRERKYIKRDFLDGMFKGGYEEVFLREHDNVIDVLYNFCYEVKNPINKILWNSVFRRLHIKNINFILNSLKDYIERANS
jgi:ribosome-associated toxin RatA of RatAB toxin-antitoxin module